MELPIQACGKWGVHMAKAHSHTPKERFTRDHGIMIKLKGMEFTYKLMDLNMKVHGSKIYSMVKEKNNGQMDQTLKGSIKLERKMDLVNTTGQMGLVMKDSGKTMKLQELAITHGLTVGNTLGTGRATLWITLVSTHGKTVACMRASIRMIRSTDMACTHGLTRKSMLVGGITVGSMVLECSCLKKVNAR